MGNERLPVVQVGQVVRVGGHEGVGGVPRVGRDGGEGGANGGCSEENPTNLQ